MLLIIPRLSCCHLRGLLSVSFLYLCFVSLVLPTGAVVNPVPMGLYNPATDDVVVLTKDNFLKTVTGSPTLWFIEFYNSWCGHCMTFAPTYKELATDLKDWSCFVRVGALDCADNQNVVICRTYDVNAFPTIRTFFPFTTINDTGMFFDKPKTIPEMRNHLVDLSSHYFQKTGDKRWQRLQPVGFIHDILKLQTKSHAITAVIIEEKSSRLGRELILDLCKYPTILVRRMISVRAFEKYQIKEYPSLFLIEGNGQLKKVTVSNKTRESFRNVLKKLSGYNIHASLADHQKSSTVFSPKSTKFEKFPLKSSHRPVHGVYMSDILSGIHYMFRQEIPIRKAIHGRALKALQNLTLVLSKYVPGPPFVRLYLEKVHSWLMSVNYFMTGSTWIENIETLQTKDAYLPDKIEWISCKGSRPKYRGYPCSLWMLFHSLTVSAYKQNKNDISVPPYRVLLAVSDYIHYFFGCNECSHNFQKMASTMLSEVSTVEESVLWLWRAHNKVNKRLSGDLSEDPAHLKIIFPSREMCPLCYMSDNSSTYPKWREKEVLRFLVSFYSKILTTRKTNRSSVGKEEAGGTKLAKDTVMMPPIGSNTKAIVAVELDWWEKKQRREDLQKLIAIRVEKRNLNFTNLGRNRRDELQSRVLPHRTKGPFWIFNEIDIGMCVIFYIFCLSLIIFLYFHFARRKNKRFCKLLPF